MTSSPIVETTLPGGRDLQETAAFFARELGFRLWTIYPADDPRVAILTYDRGRLRLDADRRGDPGTLRLIGEETRSPLTAPNGTRILFEPLDPWPVLPEPQPSLTLLPAPLDESGWNAGRAGMLYRDLIPSRWGGYCIASHIRIPEAGPVPDSVHFHRVTFQMIYCLRGWVRLVYQDQGEPFTMKAGDCVLQPPEIRHRVLESSAGLEVLEVGLPAEHPTHFDWEMPLPNGPTRTGLSYNGQRLVFHQADESPEAPVVDIGITEATNGDYPVLRHTLAAAEERTWVAQARGRLLFGLFGGGQLQVDAEPPFAMMPDAAVALPPGASARLQAGEETQVLEISL